MSITCLSTFPLTMRRTCNVLSYWQFLHSFVLQLIQHSVNLRRCHCVCVCLCVCGRTVKCPAISNILVCQLEFCQAAVTLHWLPAAQSRPGPVPPTGCSPNLPYADASNHLPQLPGSIVTWISCGTRVALSAQFFFFFHPANRLCTTNAYQKFVTCQKLRPFFSYAFCMKVQCKAIWAIKAIILLR